MTGSVDGKIEAWDPRWRERVGILDCAMEALSEDAATTDQVTTLTSNLICNISNIR